MLKIPGQGRAYIYLFPCPGLLKPKLHGMKHLTVKGKRRLLPAIDRVSQHRMAYMGHMHPYLMGAARLQNTFQI